MSHPSHLWRAPGNDGSGLVIVIPTYNERRTLPVVVERVQAALPAAHLLVVDDSSPDGTGEWADSLAQGDGRIHCLHRPSKSGLATAYVEGCSGATASWRRWTPTGRTAPRTCPNWWPAWAARTARTW